MIKIINSSGNEIYSFLIKENETTKVRVQATQALSVLKICLTKANFFEDQLASESNAVANFNGKEVNDIIEGRKLPGGDWQSIDGFDNSLTFASLSEDETVEIELRIDTTTIEGTIGEIATCLAFRFLEV